MGLDERAGGCPEVGATCGLIWGLSSNEHADDSMGPIWIWMLLRVRDFVCRSGYQQNCIGKVFVLLLPPRFKAKW